MLPKTSLELSTTTELVRVDVSLFLHEIFNMLHCSCALQDPEFLRDTYFLFTEILQKMFAGCCRLIVASSY